MITKSTKPLSKRFLRILIILACVACPCCKTKEDSPTIKRKPKVERNSTIIYRKDTTYAGRGRVGDFRDLAANFNLPFLTGGFQGLYIRVWFNNSKKESYIIDLRLTKFDSNCTIISYIPEVVDSLHISVFILDKKVVVPRFGWNKFYTYIQKLDIQNIMPEKKLTGDQIGYSTFGLVTVEIDAPFQYRHMVYDEPVYFRNVDTGCRQIYEFLQYFDLEMGTVTYDIPPRNF